MSIVRVNDIDFHVEDHGNGTPLVLLHGFTGSAASWSPVIQDLARFRRVVAIDIIGHGATRHRASCLAGLLDGRQAGARDGRRSPGEGLLADFGERYRRYSA